MKRITNANHRLELEVKGTARLNKLANPVANTNSFQYNQTPNPDLFETIEPYGYAEMDADYRVNEYPAIPGPQAGFYYWNSEIGAYGDWAIWQDLNYKAPGLVATSEGMSAKPGERWTASFQARYMDPAWINSYTTNPQWTVALGAYNGDTYLSDVATVAVNLGTSYDAGWNAAARTTAVVSVTPANTTNVRWRVYNVTDLPAAGQKRLTLEIRKGFSVKREFLSVPGWTATNLEVYPTMAGWGYGPTVFEGKPTTTTGQIVRSTNVTGLVAGNYAGVATDFVSSTGATVRVGMEFLNSSNAQVGSTTWSSTITGTNFKQRVGVSAVIPATATQVRMVIDPQDNKVFQWDAAVLVMDATTLAVAQQTGFKETSGFAVTNKIINPTGATGTNGWTPASGIVTLTAESGGISLDFPMDSDSRVNPVNPIGAYSNIFECAPGNWISARVTLRGGRGAGRVRYEWLSATNVSQGYSEWSGVTYFNGSAQAYADTMIVPAGAFRCRLHIQFGVSVAMWDGPFYTHFEPPIGDFSFTGAEALVGETMGGVTGVPNSEVITWLNMFNSTTSVEIHRGELDPGVLVARIADSTLDPNVNMSVRPDARVRYTVQRGDGTWQPLFTGELRNIDVEYPYGGKTIVNIQAIDNIRTLNNETVAFGVPTLGALTHVMTGSDVPWNISASDATTNTKVNGEVTSRLDQIILTRDTQKGFAFVDKSNTLQIRGRTQQTALANKVSFYDKAGPGDTTNQTYGTDVHVTNSSADVINAVEVETLTWNGSATVKTVSPVYTNGTSINEWGLRKVKVTLNGGTGAPTAQTWATDVMAMHASPVPTVNELQFRGNDDYLAWDRAVDLELYDNIRVRYSRINLDRTYLVQELHHTITPAGWTVKVVFRNNAGLATLLSVNLGS